MRLYDLHQRLVLQLGELAAGPVAVVRLPDPLVGVHTQLGAGVEQRLHGLLAALQGAGDDFGDRQRGEPPGQLRGLLGAALVEGDAGRPAGEQPSGVGGRTSVPYENQGGHAAQRKRVTRRPGGACGQRQPECGGGRVTGEYAP